VIDWQAATVMITGGTGSFGQHMINVLLREYHPRRIIVYSRDEWKQHAMRAAGLQHPSLRWFLGDVRDRARLTRAMRGVDVILHAAALKQVPACEYNPIEAVATNVNGCANVIDAALDNQVPRVLAISTDKATAPLNIYGATKLVGEKLFIHANHYNQQPRTMFACVRYGNVVRSRGSVVPLFEAQRASGRLTITDERMTRFWMTMEQGVRFVIRCVEEMHGGEVFIPKLPSMKVVDIARAIAPEAEVEFTGIRSGEKLHEALLSADEARQTVDVGNRYVMLPSDQPALAEPWLRQGQRLPEGFAYTSEHAAWQLTAAELLGMLGEREPAFAPVS
jgi:UDP-N-acetylglucosamine 4,6-dehydratase/5-epimerase